MGRTTWFIRNQPQTPAWLEQPLQTLLKVSNSTQGCPLEMYKWLGTVWGPTLQGMLGLPFQAAVELQVCVLYSFLFNKVQSYTKFFLIVVPLYSSKW